MNSKDDTPPFLFDLEDRVVVRWGVGTIKERKYDWTFGKNRYEIAMDCHPAAPSRMVAGKLVHFKQQLWMATEGSLTRLSDFIAENIKYGSTYEEIMNSLRKETDAQRERKLLQQAGYMVDPGEGI
jgi:hypothetical protein